MKNILTLSVAILAMNTSVNAQSKTLLQPQSNLQPTHMRVMNMLLNRTNNNPAEKTTTIKQRVVGYSSWDQTPNVALADSATFGYNSNYRGSVYNYNYMTYYFNYPSLNDLALEYIASEPERIDVKADSIIRFVDNGIGIGVSEKQHFMYNAANKITDYNDDDYTVSPTYMDRYIHTYDANGRLTMRLNLSDNGSGTWDTSAREFFTYNAQGKVTLDSVENYDGVNIWSPVAKITYTYDANANPTNITLLADPGVGSMIPFLTYDNTFYANNTLKTSVFGINQTGNSVDPAYLDSFGYANGVTNYFNMVEEYQYDANTSAFIPSYLQTRHINSQNLPDTVYASQWNGAQWVDENKTVYTYNSFNNPENAKTYSISVQPDNITTYYYEQYNDPTSVPAVANNWEISAYPNPVSGSLNVNWKNATIGAPVTISIVGMNGQLVYSESLRWNQATQQLSLGSLQPGIYAMTITDQKGAQMFHQNIVKQ